ncbi:hypothetical protein KFE96_01660 [Kordiimonas sp. SCSIO 12603]|uniref:hypothetical protein n=1 Tax=Kordiimonas sp. SCSIO 12603 TaxID=2829596 RepID=UPI00210629D2|nr:hypothetical protein [Kordiimonas sp. SCSIO 12603]UTW59039.1 hypothetical protein KFE96_01660 [Kordiimonas sp. SCSIO 12603]
MSENFRLKQLPVDDNIWQVTQLGRLVYRPEEVAWEVHIHKVAKRSRKRVVRDNNYYKIIYIGSGLIFDVPIGSLWKNGKRIDVGKYIQKLTVSIDSWDQRILSLEDKGNGQLSFVGYEVESYSHPYLCIGFGSKNKAVIIKCSELLRFYFCCFSSIAQNLFGFDDNGINEDLFIPELTGWKADDPEDLSPKPGFVISPKTILDDASAFELGAILSTKTSLQSLIKLTQSVRALVRSPYDICPIVRLPFSGRSNWLIRGKKAAIRIKNPSGQAANSNEITETDAYIVSQLLSCSSEAAAKTLYINRSRKKVRKIDNPTVSVGSIPTDIVKPSNFPAVTDDIPADNNAPKINLNRGDMSLRRPGLAKIKKKQAITRVSSGGHHGYDVDNIEECNDFTSTSGRGDTGHGHIKGGGKNSKKNDIDENEEDKNSSRDGLPRIFEDIPNHLIHIRTAHVITLPQRLRTMVSGVSYFRNRLGGEYGIYQPSIGPNWNEECVVFDLPEEWGVNATVKKRSRSAVFFEFKLSHAQKAFFFALEEKSGSHPRYFAISLKDLERLSLGHVSWILYQKIKKGKWPNRTLFNGDFYTVEKNLTQNKPKPRNMAEHISLMLGTVRVI